MRDISQIPELEAIRLLETARATLRSSSAGSREEKTAVAVALTAVDAILAAKHQASTENSRQLAEHVRFAARALTTSKDEKVQQAMVAMMAAADMA